MVVGTGCPQGASLGSYTGGEDAGSCLVKVERADAPHPICDQCQDVAGGDREVTCWGHRRDTGPMGTSQCHPPAYISPPFREMTILS